MMMEGVPFALVTEPAALVAVTLKPICPLPTDEPKVITADPPNEGTLVVFVVKNEHWLACSVNPPAKLLA